MPNNSTYGRNLRALISDANLASRQAHEARFARDTEALRATFRDQMPRDWRPCGSPIVGPAFDDDNNDDANRYWRERRAPRNLDEAWLPPLNC
jgi:hypothetical protein